MPAAGLTRLAVSLQKMVGFRNIAVHDYQTLLIPIVTEVIRHHLDDFLRYSQHVLQRAHKTSKQRLTKPSWRCCTTLPYYPYCLRSCAWPGPLR